MKDAWVTTIVGGLLVLGAAVMLAAHRRTWRAQQADDALDEFERAHDRRRYRRRMQTSSLIAVIGFLIALSPAAVPDMNAAPRLFAAWWLAALLLTLWVIALALADIISTRAHSSIALARIRVRQQELERRMGELQRRQSNGRSEGP